MTGASPTGPDRAAASGPGALSAGYGLALLCAANMFSFADRTLLGIVVEPVRRDLALSDTQISIVSGLAFVAFNLVVGVFISRWVDRGNRRNILAAGVALWSGATWATAYAGDFTSLAACRMLVGVGEATVFPVAMSLLADLYSPVRLPRSVSVFQASTGIGVVGGSILAGVLAAALGWRNMFAICGAAGLALVLLMVLTLREPARGRQDAAVSEPASPSGLFASVAALMRQPGFVWLALGYGASSMVLAVLPTWGPAFLLRSHGVPLAQVGAAIGPAAGLGGIAGTIAAGFVATWLVRRSGIPRTGLLVPIVALPFAAPAFATFLFAPALPVALIGVALTNFLMASSLGPCVSLAVGMAPPSRRGLTSTMMLTAQGVLGGALAPLVVGLASDALTGPYGPESLRYALSVIIAAPLGASAMLLAAYRRVGR